MTEWGSINLWHDARAEKIIIDMDGNCTVIEKSSKSKLKLIRPLYIHVITIDEKKKTKSIEKVRRLKTKIDNLD